MVIYTRQLATLLEARLPLNNALKVLYGQTSNKLLKEATYRISEDIDSGLSFSQALARQGTIFPSSTWRWCGAAEVTGNLNEIATFLADYTGARRRPCKQSVIGAHLSRHCALALRRRRVHSRHVRVSFHRDGVRPERRAAALVYANAFDHGNFPPKWWIVVIAAVALGFGLVSIIRDGRRERAA